LHDLAGVISAPWNLCNATLTRAQGGEFDGASEQTKENAVQELIRRCSSAVAVYALQPLPGVDSAIVIPVHNRMVGIIARIRGYRIDARRVDQDILGPLSGELLFTHAAMVGAKLIPFVDIFAVSVAYALTCALGQVSDEYYRRRRAMAEREMRLHFDACYAKAYEFAFREKRNEFRAMFRDRKVREQIGELKKARRDGTIAAEEVERRIDDILNRK
jgi:uncharacterized protein (DUF697 family)